MRVVIIDYGMGNIKYIGINEIILTNKYQEISTADKIILPGVGSFSKAIQNVKKLNLDKFLYDAVMTNKKPIFGICLGMQLMGESSDENGLNDGLGFIPAKVTKFDIAVEKVPHVGFNQVEFCSDSRLYAGLTNSRDFYFTHSYKMNSDNDINQALCNYGENFVASYEVDNIAGTQFHPELSQTNGLKLLQNYIELF